MAITVTTDKLRAAGLPAEAVALFIELARLSEKAPKPGRDGRGIAASDFDAATGVLTLELTDGSRVSTADLRGRDLSAEYAALLAEVVAARGAHASLASRQAAVERIASVNAGGVIPGRYYDNAFAAAQTANAAGAANRVELAPFFLSRQLTVDRIGVSVATGVPAALGRCCVYASGADGWPGDLIWEGGGDLDLSAVAFVEHVLAAPITLAASTVYWLGHRHSSTATLRGVAVGSALSLGPVSSASNQYASVIRRTLAFATALPATWGFAEADLVGNVSPPAIRMRAV